MLRLWLFWFRCSFRFCFRFIFVFLLLVQALEQLLLLLPLALSQTFFRRFSSRVFRAFSNASTCACVRGFFTFGTESVIASMFLCLQILFYEMTLVITDMSDFQTYEQFQAAVRCAREIVKLDMERIQARQRKRKKRSVPYVDFFDFQDREICEKYC